MRIARRRLAGVDDGARGADVVPGLTHPSQRPPDPSAASKRSKHSGTIRVDVDEPAVDTGVRRA
jgi:hypothetical protein